MAAGTKLWNYYLQILQHCPVPLVIIKGWGQNNNNNTPTKLNTLYMYSLLSLLEHKNNDTAANG